MSFVSRWIRHWNVLWKKAVCAWMWLKDLQKTNSVNLKCILIVKHKSVNIWKVLHEINDQKYISLVSKAIFLNFLKPINLSSLAELFYIYLLLRGIKDVKIDVLLYFLCWGHEFYMRRIYFIRYAYILKCYRKNNSTNFHNVIVKYVTLPKKCNSTILKDNVSIVLCASQFYDKWIIYIFIRRVISKQEFFKLW